MSKTTNTPPEEDIQKILKVLEKTHPEKATREYAIKTIEKMKTFANMIVDKIDEDLQSGKLEVDDKGEAHQDSKLISQPAKKVKPQKI